jgi:type II secretory pathway pseudopilin PulG
MRDTMFGGRGVWDRMPETGYVLRGDAAACLFADDSTAVSYPQLDYNARPGGGVSLGLSSFIRGEASMARKFRRRGFGAPDLLILTVIAAIIATMAFRGITRARETARRLRCSQQLRDLGAALNQYEINVRFYPGYRNVLLMTNGTSYSDPLSGHGGVSWIVPILPYLDYAQIYEMIRTPADEGNDPNGKPIKTAKDAMVPIEYLWCPNSPPTALGLGMTPLSCVVNTGCIDAEGAPGGDGKVGMPRDWPANGVFFDRFTGIHVAAGKPDGKVDEKEKPKSYPIVSMSTSWISSRDGVAHTLLLSENLDHGQWTDVFEQPLGLILLASLVGSPRRGERRVLRRHAGLLEPGARLFRVLPANVARLQERQNSGQKREA